MNLNIAIIEGNLVHSPELKTVGQDLKICQFTLACNQGYGDKKYTNYFDVKVFGKNAENCQSFLAKGQSTKVIGNLKQERWKKSDGSNASKIIIEATQVIFGFKKENQEANEDNPEVIF